MLARTLGSILREAGAPPTVDYLSLDVEGHEDDVLLGFEWNEFAFLALTIERVGPALSKLLERHGYARAVHHRKDDRVAGRRAVYGPLDELWLSRAIPGGLDAARARAEAAAAEWRNASRGSINWRGLRVPATPSSADRRAIRS